MASIISVHSYRGGTGKSNFTSNIAALLARQGHRVAVVDSDLDSPGVHVPFGLMESDITRGLNHYLWGECSIKDVAIDVTDRIMSGGNTSERTALYLLPASMQTGDIARIVRDSYDVTVLNDGYSELIDALDLDFLCIDTHPGVNEETLLSVAVSDYLFIMLRPDAQDFQGTAITVELAKKLGVPNLYVVLNKVLGGMDRAFLKERVSSSYDVEVAGVLPFSEDMMLLGSGDLFTQINSDHPLTEELEEISKLIKRPVAAIS